MTPEDIRRLRNETPSCQSICHFDNAGASLMPNPVFQSIADHLELERKFGGYEAAARTADRLEKFYTSVAALLGAQSEDIAFAENATRAWDMAVYALPLKDDDRILTHASEYRSNYLAFLHLSKRRGVHIDLIPSDEFGQVDLDAIPKLITPRTRVLALTHVPMQDGLINPVADAGKIAREYGLIYVLDSCQAAGQLTINVKEIGCHILTGTGRKFLRGPRGTGFLYIDGALADTLDPPFIDATAANWTGPQTYDLMPGARRFESFERNFAGMLGLMTAVDYARAIGLQQIENRIATLSHILREKLSDLPHVRLRDQGQKKSGIVTFEHLKADPSVVAAQLKQQNITVSILTENQAWLDLQSRKLPSLVRASVHYFNTEDEIDHFRKTLEAI